MSQDTPDQESQECAGLSRRDLLVGGAAGLGALSLLGGPAGIASASSAGATGISTVPQHGKQRLVVWALAAIADWNLSYDVGFYDATRMLGWKYRKVGVPIAQYSAATHLNAINNAIDLHPDVLVTPDWVQGVAPTLAKAQKKGIYVIVNNALNFPSAIANLGIPFVGANIPRQGQITGKILAQTLLKKGKKSGTIIAGNSYPENRNQEDVVVGLRQAIASFNKAHHTSYKVDELSDQSGASLVQAISLYKAKMTQLGPDFIGILAVADTSTQAAMRALKERGARPGQYPIGAVDNSAEALQEIKQGWVTNVLDAGFYTSGWLPVMLAWQRLERGYSTSTNYDTLNAPITKGTLKKAQAANALQLKLAKAYGVVTT